MRTRLAVLMTALVLCLNAPGGARASQDCATADLSAPLVGSRSVTRCVPGLFTQRFWVQNCKYVPPAALSLCLTVTLYTP